MPDTRQGAYYAIIPAPVLYDTGLEPRCKLLFAQITALCNGEGYCWASNEYLAEISGVSVRTVQRMISRLEARGYIQCEMASTEKGSERRIYAGMLPAREGDDKTVTTLPGGDDNSVRRGDDNSVTPPIEVEEFNINNNPPIPPGGGSGHVKLSQPKWHPEWFNPLYDFYPNHKGRQDACRAWDKLRPDRDFCRMMYESVRLQKRSVAWLKDGGDYIPQFSRWLNGRKWEDEVRLADPVSVPRYAGWADDPEVMG